MHRVSLVSPSEFSGCHYLFQTEFDWAIIVLLCSLLSYFVRFYPAIAMRLFLRARPYSFPLFEDAGW